MHEEPMLAREWSLVLRCQSICNFESFAANPKALKTAIECEEENIESKSAKN